MPSGFHPLVSQWFLESIGEPTSAQRRGWDAIRAGRHTLIAAPTGSGKTLAAFLSALDDLVREGCPVDRSVRLQPDRLPDEVRVVYVSPLKALSADIHKNLAEPRKAIRQLGEASGTEIPRITAAVRTGDTPASERAAMLRTPPHILVTTPESLYLLLTADRSRQMLRTVRTVIVDEIHAVIGTRRGAHLALTLERLEALCGERTVGPPEGGPHDRPEGGPSDRPDRSIQRIGLSATQKPIDEVARFLVGNDESRGGCAIIDEGHRRTIDLSVEIPASPLSAVMAHEVWEEYYDRLAALITEHKTTLVFVNTRRLAERVARHLSERIGDELVTAHHGSLSKERRLDAEHRLKTGTLKALVATASLELGIDIGHVDLVCQIGSPHRIATLLQRVGRSGHSIAGVPKGRMLPVSLDDLVECAALLRAARRGDLDAIVSHDAPLDVLAQQITAETSCRAYDEAELFALARRAWPYRALSPADFDAVVAMVSDGFATPRGRRSALVHHDEVNRTLRGRRGSRLLSLVSGGAIPEVADYRVVLEPEETFIGTVNEDFAIESMAGDIFQLGNASWQISQVVAGTVRVRDAQGAPPTIPFWLGEAPARSDELSLAVSELRAGADAHLAEPKLASQASVEWLMEESGLSREAALQAIAYMAEGRRVLGVVPTQSTLVLERFFDEAGGMQLVLHAPFGSRVNRAWALALRKRFCRQFNFELQAAATEDAVLLSLGPQHSFPLADVFRYLHSASVRDILVQAFLDAPVFQTRWRWNATISLAVPRNRGGRKVPPQLQRMQADDLMAAVFPDAAACIENIPGDREIPDHPLVNQTVRDCLEEAMDLEQLQRVLDRIHRGEVTCISRDTPEPSAFSHDILNARPYAFVDDAPLEERRTQAVHTRRAGGTGGDISALDAGAVERVRDEVRPDPRDLDELHDALLTSGFMLGSEVEPAWCVELAGRGRATCARIGPPEGGPHVAVWVAAERLPEWLAVHPDAVFEPRISPPPSRAARTWTRDHALVELLRGRVAILGPVVAQELASSLGVTEAAVDSALLALESEGVILRGSFTPGSRGVEWCDRRLLARIHRYTLNRLRAEISPVSPAELMRFLFTWQHVDRASRLAGIEGLRAVLAQLDGLELPARAWERDVLAARLERYESSLLDTLCLTGEVGWARLSSGPTQVVGATPIALFLREHGELWSTLRSADEVGPVLPPSPLATARLAVAGEASVGGSDVPIDAASRILDHLRARGASFGQGLRSACNLSEESCRTALGELVASGLITSDGFAGLRAITGSTSARRTGADTAGRWSLLRSALGGSVSASREDAVKALAWTLLSRYGVVFRRLLAREPSGVPWRELVRVYRTLEARGEIRGGRFVSGMSGEQFALPDAVDRLREVRRSGPDDALVTITGADPLNLTGIVTPGDRIRAAAGSRIVFRNGVPLAALEGDMLRTLGDIEPAIAADVAAAAAGRRVPVVSGYVGRV
ncbi:MAG TPA: DEAD/DEAH box helicase [Vicinamibacterales bacterium]|nr:DEAD/DEAH box helicase [Vicinamibacterales bacterium]